MARIPRIKGVTPIGNSELFVRFENGAEKTYDCKPLLSRPEFHLLKVPAFSAPSGLIPAATGFHGMTTWT